MSRKPSPGSRSTKGSPSITHSRARRQYEVIQVVECGITLLGPEVKSLREGNGSLDEAYAGFRGDELFLLGMHIDEYHAKGYAKHEPIRPRKLLLHKRELAKLRIAVQRRGLTLVPMRLYWSPRNIAKIELALARGRKLHDKRATVRERDAKREMDRVRRSRR